MLFNISLGDTVLVLGKLKDTSILSLCVFGCFTPNNWMEFGQGKPRTG